MGGRYIQNLHSSNQIGKLYVNETKDASFSVVPLIEAHLFVFSDGLVYAASAVSSSQTSRHAGVVLISLDDTPICAHISDPKTGKTSEVKGHAIALAPGVNRSIKIGEGGALSIHFDPSHPVYFAMSQCL